MKQQRPISVFVGSVVLASALLAGCAPPTSDELLNSARTAWAAGEMRTAEIHLKNLLQQDPSHVDARAMLGQAQLANGDAASAEASLRRAMELGADPAANHVQLLRSLFEQGKLAEVREAFQTGVGLPEEAEVEALAIVAGAERGLGAYDAAEDHLLRAIAVGGQTTPLRTQLASTYFLGGRRPEAWLILAQALATDPNYVPALLLQGMAFGDEKLYAQARASLEAVLANLKGRTHERDYSTALVLLVEMELQQGAVEEAAAHGTELSRVAPQLPVARYLRAKIDVTQGALDTARQQLETLVADAPQYWAAHTLLGSVASKQGRIGEAVSYLRTALTNSPGDRTARLLLADLYIRQGNGGDARALLVGGDNAISDGALFALAAQESRLLGDAELAAAYFGRSEQGPASTPEEVIALTGMYINAGDAERAARLVDASALNQSDKQWLSQYVATLVHVSQGRIESAAQTAEALVATSPNALALTLRGIVALTAKDFARADDIFSNLVEQEPRNVEFLKYAGAVALARDDQARATAFFERVIGLVPNHAEATMGLAQVALRRGELARAEELIAHVPDNADAFRLRGSIAMARGNAETAAAMMARAFATQPTADAAIQAYRAARTAGKTNPHAELMAWTARAPHDVPVNLVLGSYALEQGQLDLAIESFEAVLITAPNETTALNNLAWLYGERGDERALGLAERAYAQSNDNPSVADTLGWLYFQRGQISQALPLLERAFTAMSGEPEIRYHWGAALAAAQETRRALETLRPLVGSTESYAGRDNVDELVADLERKAAASP